MQVDQATARYRVLNVFGTGTRRGRREGKREKRRRVPVGFGTAVFGLFVHTLALVCPFRSFGQTKPADEGPVKPLVVGEVREIHSTELGENRVLNVYLPDGYRSSDTVRYPVVYLLDGGADEDFLHVAGLYQFNSFEWINRVPKSIVVGIVNVDRRRDFTFPTSVARDKKQYPTTGGSEKFINFLQNELQPYVNRTFKTNGTRTVIGESLGGLLAAEILLKRPLLFNEYVIVSPSIWWDNGLLLGQPAAEALRSASARTKVYVGVGKEGLARTDPPRVMEVDANLLADKLQKEGGKTLAVYFDYLPGEDHATIMHQAVFNALRLLHPLANKQ